MKSDRQYTPKETSLMMRALALARRGGGFVAPNPMVGAVITNGGKLVGWGWHRRAGDVHAEIEALERAGSKARGGDLYVTLAPCNHFGRTPPCTEAILKAGISRVVAAIDDPNPQVKGGGLKYLHSQGIKTEVGLLGNQAAELNAGWIHWVRTKRPLVVLKLAISLDGKIAPANGQTQWLSGEVARAQVQRLRRTTQAILVGKNTVLKDNPRLTNRTGSGYRPLRVVVDSELEVAPSSHIYQAIDGLTKPEALVVTTSRASFERRQVLELAGVEVSVLEKNDGQVDLEALLVMLGEKGIQTVLCEGGAELGTNLLRQRLCDRVLLYQCPMLIGKSGKSFFDFAVGDSLQDAIGLELIWNRKVGRDGVSYYRVGGRR